MIEYDDNWDNIHGLRAKHGYAFTDEYNSLAYFGYQQVTTMLKTWAKRELFNDHAVHLKTLAEEILHSTKVVRVVLGPHQAQQFNGEWYLHITVMSSTGKSYHFFNKFTVYFSKDQYRLEAAFCGASPSATIYEERFRFDYSL